MKNFAGIAVWVGMAMAAVGTDVLAQSAANPSKFFVKPFQVFDTHDRAVGRLRDGPRVSSVEIVAGGVRYMVPMSVTGDANTWSTVEYDFESAVLMYLEPDCKGTAYTFADGYGMPWGVTLLKPSGQVVFFPAAARAQGITIASEQYGPLGCYASGGSTTAVALGDPIDITGRYARPFHVR